MSDRSVPTLCVWAQSWSKGISKEGEIPWSVPDDFKFFLKSLKLAPEGKKTAMVCGRGTYEAVNSINLQNSIPILISRTHAEGKNPRERVLKSGAAKTWDEYWAKSLDAAIQMAKSLPEVGMIVIAGGAAIYSETVERGLADALWVTQFTRSDGPFETDNEVEYQPDTEDSPYECTEVSKTKVSGEGESRTSFAVYTYEKKARKAVPAPTGAFPSAESLLHPKPTSENLPRRVESLPAIMGRHHEEFQYLDLIKEVMNDGDLQMDRTKVGTKSVFGRSMRYSLADGCFPLLTTKRVFWRGVVEELLWFLKGDTNAKTLQDQGIKIWDGNSSREFLDARGLGHREEGDLGPIYGFQWRHYGADYKTMHTDYTGQGVDQIQEVIDTLRNNPTDRRMIVCAWNPKALPDMALPPCHCLFQFYASGDGKLSCVMYQRSADIGLGVPFNIASYSLLTVMIAQLVGMEPHEFIHVMGNTHVYSNHFDALEEQLGRTPRPFPLLKINQEKKSLEDFILADFELVGYRPYKTIPMKMAV